MVRSRTLVITATLAAAALTAGCGFHLEGRTVLPAAMRRPYIEASNQQSDFVQSLRRDLLGSGAYPTEDSSRASAEIDILHDQVQRTVLAVSATDRPTEYQVTYTVRFSVSAGGKTLLASRTVTATRSYSFDENLLLAKEHEEAILTGAMAQDLADIVMRRLARL